MNLVLFIHEDSSENGIQLKNHIQQEINGIDLQIFQTFNSLKSRLKCFSHYRDRDIFILLAESKKRWNELVSLIDLLEDKRIILILPDDSKITISGAHKLFPRFFTFVNDTYDDLGEVLKKMIKKEKIKTTN
ncbi:MAG: hypothetical protein GY699_05660 [Desulfobacteraceae bacterium]|nr:hypothetical protein [Desulfobacteraceae bacterium]